MCENNGFISRFKTNHELHGIIIALIIYWQSKNIMLSGGISGLIYYVMMIRDKKQKQKSWCGCNDKKIDNIQVIEKKMTIM